MAKVLVSIEEKLLDRIDRAARDAGLTRSAYLSRLAQRELGDGKPGSDPRVRRAFETLDRLFAENPVPVDPTTAIRQMRDER
jgi:hypothetical protein